MPHYFQCDECKKPVKEEETQIIMLRPPDYRQYYCAQCFASISPAKISEKRFALKGRKKKTTTTNKKRVGCC
jgi:hypothetical protein